MAVDAFKTLLRCAALAAIALSAAACANKENSPEAALKRRQERPGHAGHAARLHAERRRHRLLFDRSDRPDAGRRGQILAKQAQWLQQYPQYTITIEGHADERGTREYNIALGAKRATSVRNYLASNGINAQRIRTISYGKERPVAVCNDISCWSQNRRAQTVLNSGGQISQR